MGALDALEKGCLSGWRSPMDPSGGSSMNTDSNTNQERRQFARLQVSMKCSVTVEKSSGEVRITPANLRDISQGGALVVTAQPLAAKQPVTFSIPVSQRVPVAGMPPMFSGTAVTLRVYVEMPGRTSAALRFEDGLSQNPQFAAFLEFVQARAGDGA